MSIARRALAVVSLPDGININLFLSFIGIYAIGGFNGNSYLKNVERFDEQSEKWTEIA